VQYLRKHKNGARIFKQIEYKLFFQYSRNFKLLSMRKLNYFEREFVQIFRNFFTINESDFFVCRSFDEKAFKRNEEIFSQMIKENVENSKE
jgi:hypothetical protein